MNKPEFIILENKNVMLVNDWVSRYGIVKRGFISDGVSVPYIFRWFIHRRGSLLCGAIFHDYYYLHAIKSKHFADKAFYNIAIESGANKIKAKIAYYAVHFFGKGNY